MPYSVLFDTPAPVGAAASFGELSPGRQAAEATDQLQGNYAAGIQEYEKIHSHILGLADLLSNGIIQEFPKKFDKGK